MGSIKFFASVLMVGLFAIAIVTFATQFGNDNSSAILLSDDEQLNTLNNEINSTITTWHSSVNDTGTTFFSTTQDQGDQSATSGGQFKSGINGALSMATKAMTSGYNKIFGSDGGFGIFLTGLTGILLFMLVAYGWKYWKGNPD